MPSCRFHESQTSAKSAITAARASQGCGVGFSRRALPCGLSSISGPWRPFWEPLRPDDDWLCPIDPGVQPASVAAAARSLDDEQPVDLQAPLFGPAQEHLEV
jgi:hypothetical protein